jgi:hypothetical protein
VPQLPRREIPRRDSKLLAIPLTAASSKEIPLSAHAIRLPICPVCHQPVALEEAKTDEDGAATHEDCYLRKLRVLESNVDRCSVEED